MKPFTKFLTCGKALGTTVVENREMPFCHAMSHNPHSQLRMADERKLKRFRSERRSTLSCYALRLKPGEEIMECLLAYVKDNNLKAPFVLSCVGSVTKATLRMANASRDTTGEIIEVKGRHEIVSLVGTLAGGGHLHASLSDKDGHVVGGHVIGNMTVFTTAEVVIGNCDMLLFSREMDDQTGFDELVVKEKWEHQP